MLALVTGASSGIGKEYTRQLASDYGCDLLLVSNQQAELEQTAQEIMTQYGVSATAHYADLGKADAAEELYAYTESAGIKPDIVINDAGVFFFNPYVETAMARIELMLNLHVVTVAKICRLYGEQMAQRGSGYILNMSSMTARIPAPGIAVYSASKAYLKSFGRSFSYEMRPYGVRVTTVCPAAIDTGLYPLGTRLRKTLRRLGIIRSPHWLARRAVKALFRGRRTISPGLTNALVPALVAILPPRMIDRLGMKWIQR